MLATSVLALALAATGFAQVTVPEGYKTVYLATMVNQKFVIVPKAAQNGSTIVVNTLANTPAQQWYVKPGNVTGKIQLANTNLCLDGGAKSNWKDMANIYLNTCVEGAESQTWVVMNDGRIPLAASKPQECIDLQYMRATANNPVGFYSCAGLGNTGAADKGINWPLIAATP